MEVLAIEKEPYTAADMPIINPLNRVKVFPFMDITKARSTYTVLRGGFVIPGIYVPAQFAQTRTNLLNGVYKRLTAQHSDAKGVVEPKKAALAHYANFCRKKIHRHFKRCKTVEFEQFIKERGYTGAKLERYKKAWVDYNEKGLEPKDSYINAFCKVENQDPQVSAVKQPRIVQSRGYTYALRFGQHLDGIEHQLYKFKGWGKGVEPSAVFGKGHCPLKRGKTILRKFKQFKDPEVLMFDLTGFDSTIKEALLRITHELYTKCNSAEEFAELLKQQLKTKGFTKYFSYTIGTGGRCSGDFDTSCGNAYLMATALACYCEVAGIEKWDLYCDGDDTLLFVEKGRVDHDSITKFYRDLGMILRVEGVAHQMEDIKWCQCKPVLIRGVYRMTPDFTKKISHLLSSSKMGGGYMRCVADNELQVSNGVPILGAFASLLDRSSTGYSAGVLPADMVYKYSNAVKSYGKALNRNCLEPTYEARQSFALAYGVSIADQVLWESQLDQCLLDPSNCKHLQPLEWFDVP